jgi:hypothetical protein
MKARYKIVDVRENTAVVNIKLEDGRGFILFTGIDRVKNEIKDLIKIHTKSLYGVDVDKIEEEK